MSSGDQSHDGSGHWPHANINVTGGTVSAAPLWWATSGMATAAINGIPQLWGYGGWGPWGYGGYGGWGGGLGWPMNTALPVVVHPNVSVSVPAQGKP